MTLSENEKTSLVQELALLLELNEPEAICERLRRIAQRKAQDASIGETEALRWSNLAKALAGVVVERFSQNKALEPKPERQKVSNADSAC